MLKDHPPFPSPHHNHHQYLKKSERKSLHPSTALELSKILNNYGIFWASIKAARGFDM